VQFLGICLNPLCVVTEYLPKGDLASHLMNYSNVVNDEQALKWFKGISSGMLHLALEGVVHRDLAARNVLLTETFVAKISDFGLSRQLVDGAESVQKTQTAEGPLKWMAPESILHQFYSEKTDVWAFGITMIEILTRTVPYPEEPMLSAAAKVSSGKLKPTVPTFVSRSVADTLNACFNYDPGDRPDFKALAAFGEQLTSLR